jgi:flavin-dependent dehydrogenase
MDRCDALIVGGGPAGSTCAWKLRRAGLDVLMIDAASFPRDKLCAGWITPQVVAELDLDPEAYRQGPRDPPASGGPRDPPASRGLLDSRVPGGRGASDAAGRTLQPITGFRVGLIDGEAEVETAYSRPVSFGIRRCEFDHYLWQRSGARLNAGVAISSLRRDGGLWIVNGCIRTPMLIGAGGHFCPVSRWINGPLRDAPVVAAQEAEFLVDADDAAARAIAPEAPELYFCRDLKGYGWCFRKQRYLNIGLGRLDRRSLPGAVAGFVRFLSGRGKISPQTASRWRGHAYALYGSSQRRIVDHGVLLAGDAAGLAYPQSGEGIRPAIESGLLAAATILEAKGQYTRNRLEPYQARLRARFGSGPLARALTQLLPDGLGTPVGRRLLETPAFVRHVVIERWFLHLGQPALTV